MNDHRNVSERRQHRRVLYDAPVSIQAGALHYETRLIDVSLKGRLDEAAGTLAGAR